MTTKKIFPYTRLLVVFLALFLTAAFLEACNPSRDVTAPPGSIETPHPSETLTPVPAPAPCSGVTFGWLCRKFGEGQDRPELYYQAIDPDGRRGTLDGFKDVNRLNRPETTIVRAVYYNNGDLAFGRDMNCAWASDGGSACYVTNYGPPPFLNGGRNPDWPNETQALDDAAHARNPFATVAMEYRPHATENKVTFYAYNADGNRVLQAALDGEGPKDIPQMCMACHGGTYVGHVVAGASFLPFDYGSFHYSSQSPFTRAEESQSLAALNILVLGTKPSLAIRDFLSHDLTDTDYAPSSWSEPPDAKQAYHELIAPFCRGCHLASRLNFENLGTFTTIAPLAGSYICRLHLMPHAQRPAERLSATPFSITTTNWLNTLPGASGQFDCLH